MSWVFQVTQPMKYIYVNGTEGLIILTTVISIYLTNRLNLLLFIEFIKIRREGLNDVTQKIMNHPKAIEK